MIVIVSMTKTLMTDGHTSVKDKRQMTEGSRNVNNTRQFKVHLGCGNVIQPLNEAQCFLSLVTVS